MTEKDYISESDHPAARLGYFPHELQSIALIEQVNLMTPENIHLNSFMYEPILDMAPEHLKRLYVDVKAVNP